MERARQLGTIGHAQLKLDIQRDKDHKDARGQLFLRSHGIGSIRKFGFWWTTRNPELPKPMFLRPHKDLPALIKTLKEIEAYAGTVFRLKTYRCSECPHLDLGIREFVFRPLDGGALYRWPTSFVHYMEVHKISCPQWFPELIQDFKKAQEQGLWGSPTRQLTPAQH